MRQALCYSFPLAQYAQGGDLPDSYEYAGSIIPGAARLYDESYTDLTAKGFSLGSVTYPDGSSTSDFRRSDQLTITYNARAAAAALEQVKELPQGSPCCCQRAPPWRASVAGCKNSGWTTWDWW